MKVQGTAFIVLGLTSAALGEMAGNHFLLGFGITFVGIGTGILARKK